MRRSLVALLTAALIFVLTYLSAWAAMRNFDMMALGYANHMYLWSDIHGLNEYLSEYAEKNGHYPESLEEVKQFVVQDKGVSLDSIPPSFTDPWDHPYQYEKTDKAYRLWSLGRTGKPGGVGMDAEIECVGGHVTLPKPTPFQFIFEGEGSLTLFLVALAASCSAGLIWYFRGKPPAEASATKLRLAAGVIFTIITAVVVAWFLTAYYLIVQQSGH